MPDIWLEIMFYGSAYVHATIKLNFRFHISPQMKILNIHVQSNLVNLKGYFHLCPRMDFLQTLHINNSLYTNYENVFIELDS